MAAADMVGLLTCEAAHMVQLVSWWGSGVVDMVGLEMWQPVTWWDR